MSRKKKRKGSPKAKEASDSEEVMDVRERMIKELQEEIRLDESQENRKFESETMEAAVRGTQLGKTAEVISRYWSAFQKHLRVLEQNEHWDRHMTCDGLPDPGSVPETNTFAYLWSTEESQASMDTVEEKCRVITSLLNKLKEIIHFSMEISKKQEAEYKEIEAELRKRLQRWIDFACYRLLRNIETNMISEDTKTSTYVHSIDKVVCCFWVPIALPVGMQRPVTKEQQPIEVRFNELKLTVRIPVDVDCHRMAIRGMWLGYDHFSIETHSYKMPELPEHLIELWGRSFDLARFMKKEHEEKLRIWKDQTEDRRLRLEEKRALLERIENPASVLPAAVKKKGKKKKSRSARRMDPNMMLAAALPSRSELLPYLPTPEEVVRQKEARSRLEVRKLLFTLCEKTEVNLRKYKILGGVFRVDLLYQPPQPKDLGNDTYLTTLELPKEPKFVTFSRRYVAPQLVPESERTPEVVEAEINALEAALEALVLVTLKLPDTILWFEPPLIAQWIPHKQIWSTKYVHDVKFNEEQQSITFRSGRLGVHGLAAYKFVHIPYQSWELKPEVKKGNRDYGGVVLGITATTIQVEFIVREDKVCLNSLTGHSTDPLKHVLGEFFELEHLIEQLQQLGCDLFPDRDVISYIGGINEKHPVAENHLRRCMAILSTTYTFAWSRWNSTRDFRQIVMQFREMHGCMAKQHPNLTLLVTPSKTMRIQCTEVSSEFSDLPYDKQDTEYYADLYQLALNTAGIKTRLCMDKISYKLAWTVHRLLERTRVISLSS